MQHHHALEAMNLQHPNLPFDKVHCLHKVCVCTQPVCNTDRKLIDVDFVRPRSPAGENLRADAVRFAMPKPSTLLHDSCVHVKFLSPTSQINEHKFRSHRCSRTRWFKKVAQNILRVRSNITKYATDLHGTHLMLA